MLNSRKSFQVQSLLLLNLRTSRTIMMKLNLIFVMLENFKLNSKSSCSMHVNLVKTWQRLLNLWTSIIRTKIIKNLIKFLTQNPNFRSLAILKDTILRAAEQFILRGQFGGQAAMQCIGDSGVHMFALHDRPPANTHRGYSQGSWLASTFAIRAPTSHLMKTNFSHKLEIIQMVD